MFAVSHSIVCYFVSIGAMLMTIILCFCVVDLAFQCALTSIISFETHNHPVRYVGQTLLSPFDSTLHSEAVSMATQA